MKYVNIQRPIGTVISEVYIEMTYAKAYDSHCVIFLCRKYGLGFCQILISLKTQISSKLVLGPWMLQGLFFLFFNDLWISKVAQLNFWVFMIKLYFWFELDKASLKMLVFVLTHQSEIKLALNKYILLLIHVHLSL